MIFCKNCKYYEAVEPAVFQQDKCNNPIFIESCDPVRGENILTHGGICEDLRKDQTACGPQASQFVERRGEKK